jgi:hypothetical protein
MLTQDGVLRALPDVKHHKKNPRFFPCDRVNTPITKHRSITEHPYSAGVGLCWIKKNLMDIVSLAYH